MAYPNELKGIDLSDSPEDMVCYGFDASFEKPVRPALVAWPKDTAEVSRILAYADSNRIPMVPRGAGTGMTAGSVPVEGAIALSFEKMNRVLELDEANLNVVVEPGIINGELQKLLVPYGLFYPPDPASMGFCTIGGNVAENAGGPRALKYGVTRDYVMQLEAVLPGGEVINTGVGTQKGVVGYDLTRLLVGSEGTLAAITKIRLRLLPASSGVATLLGIFGDVESAGRAVAAITAAKVIPRTLEFMDRASIEAVESYKPVGLPAYAEAILLIELDGHTSAIEAEAARVVEVLKAVGARVEVAADDAARERLWQSRRAISPALHHLNMRKINEDVVVPRSRLPEMLVSLQAMSRETGVPIINFGHAGDGNIHVNIMCPKNNEAAYKRAHDLVPRMFARVLELGGTISGEHGVGLSKAPYIGMELGAAEIRLMREVKRVFDPNNIMNPGKCFPPEDAQA